MEKTNSELRKEMDRIEREISPTRRTFNVIRDKLGWRKEGEEIINYLTIRGQLKGRQEEKEKIIAKELAMECLVCGKDLNHEIMTKKIHYHICPKCRKPIWEKIGVKVLEEKSRS